MINYGIGSSWGFHNPLVVMDSFGNMKWSFPWKTKTAMVVANAFGNNLKSTRPKRKLKLKETDDGMKHFRNFFNQLEVNEGYSFCSFKGAVFAAVCERIHR